MNKPSNAQSTLQYLFIWFALISLLGQQPAFAAANLDKIAEAYLKELGVPGDRYSVDTSYIGQQVQIDKKSGKPFTLYVYNCVQATATGLGRTQLNVAGFFRPDSILMEYNENTGEARPYILRMKGAAYIAFGQPNNTLIRGHGYASTLGNAFVVPIHNDILAAKIAKLIFLNKRSLFDSVDIHIEGDLLGGSKGDNLPWLNWRLEQVREGSEDNSIPSLDSMLNRAREVTHLGAHTVSYTDTPIALLDREGRVITGSFPIGDIDLTQAQLDGASVWKNQIVNRAQAKWAAPFVSRPDLTGSPEEMLNLVTPPAEGGTWLDVTWTGPNAKSQIFKMSPIRSQALGRAQGPYANPNYKYLLSFEDPNTQTQIQITLQHNLKDMIGRTIAFGGQSSDAGVFQSSGEDSLDSPLTVQFGSGSVSVKDRVRTQTYPFVRTVPRGTMIIKELTEDSRRNVLIGLNATLEFDIDPWTGVNSGGHAVFAVNFKAEKLNRDSTLKLSDECSDGLQAR